MTSPELSLVAPAAAAPRKVPRTGSRRQAVKRFGAYVAHLLNGSGSAAEVVLLNYGTLYVEILASLARNARFRTQIVGAEAGGKEEADAAASFYFDRVLDRALGINPGKRSSVVFDLLLAGVRRSPAVGLAEARLVALTPATGDAEAAAVPFDPELREFSANVRALTARRRGASDHTRDPASAHDRHSDPPAIEARGHRIALPPALSVWDAVSTPPRRLRKLTAGPVFLGFCSKVIGAVESAHRPYLELLNLGLRPADWLDRLPVNQVRAIGALTKAAREGSEVRTPSIERWRQAWALHPVPHFRSVEEFLASPVGRAIVGSSPPIRSVELEEELHPDAAQEDEVELCDGAEFSKLLAMAQRDRAIDALEQEVMQRLYEGESLAELCRRAEFGARIGRQRRKLEAFVEDLEQRLLAYARGRLDCIA